jgi:hypothetical protein
MRQPVIWVRFYFEASRGKVANIQNMAVHHEVTQNYKAAVEN